MSELNEDKRIDTNELPVPEAFLKEIAEAYVENERDELVDYCFVTPNKRSGAFLQHYFDELLGSGKSAGLTPEIMAISDFIADLVDDEEATRMEQLLILYNVYSEVLDRHTTEDEKQKGVNLVDFNQFQFWGDVLLNDFNDVDRYLVPAQELFKNVHDLKEISSNFLTAEQIEVINRYFNADLVPAPEDKFWRHDVASTIKSENSIATGFVKLWQVMLEIYDGFRAALSARGFSYSGKIYRDALDRVKEMGAEDFEYGRYIFVGFNVLSKSEFEIFKALQKKGIADFYWDFAAPAFKSRGNRATRFLNEYVGEFKSRYDGIGTATLDYFPEIKVLAVPSTFAQAKVIPQVLRDLLPDYFNGEKAEKIAKAKAEAKVAGKKLKKKDLPDCSDLVNTAIVLPDENLIQPILSSIPKEIPLVNVTMGFSLNHTDVAGLIKNISSLQFRSRQLRHEDSFYYEDVASILSHPLIRFKFGELCDNLMSYINENRIFNISAAEFNKPEFSALQPLFRRVGDNRDAEAVFSYLLELLQWLKSLLQENVEELGRGYIELEIRFIDAYIEAVNELIGLRDTYLKNVYLRDDTVFRLVERLVGNQRVNYDGVPLRGLQVMGVLESRSLDFENLVMTSMNERIFPRKHYSKSFIPNLLRTGYGMATIEHQESMYTYYFYRLISRARKVYLLYDNRTTSAVVGGPSRFITQLRYQFPASRFHHLTAAYRVENETQLPVVIPKTERVMKILESFRREGEGSRILSASSINKYINCPLEFYLSSVERYYPEDDVVDYMDDSTYGTVVHDTLQDMYESIRGTGDEVLLDETNLKKLLDERLIEHYLARSIRKNYLKINPDDQAELTGDSAIYLKVITRAIRRLLEAEIAVAENSTFVCAEQTERVRLKVSDSHTINVDYRIDRIDRLPDGSIRIIDYKTGGDVLSFNSVEHLFDNTKDKRPKAIFQLMLYANAYAVKNNFDGRIQPYIYSVREIARSGLTPIKYGPEKNKKPFTDYREINDEFLERFGQLLDELYDKEKPFVANPSEHSCKYCKFKSVCGVAEQ